jgi:serine/threonine protein kinase
MARSFTRTGYYKLDKNLGEGTTSRVYSGFQFADFNDGGIEVAVKIAKDHSYEKVLRLEFETLESIRCPRIVRSYGLERFDGRLGLVMEKIDGTSLAEIQRTRDLSEIELSYIFKQAKLALKSVGDAGKHHGDLSPNNILITNLGNLVLIDFGSKIKDDLVLANPRYLSPNRWRGHPPTIEDDYFSLEIIRWETQNQWRGTNWQERSLYIEKTLKEPKASNLIDEVIDSRQISEAAKSLAKSVVRIISSKEKAFGSTQLAVKRGSKASWVAATLLFLFTAFGVCGDQEIEKYFGGLEVRTDKWTKIQLNGIDLGYTPVSKRKIEPGTYNLTFQTPKETGEIQVLIKKGQITKLSNIDFE